MLLIMKWHIVVCLTAFSACCFCGIHITTGADITHKAFLARNIARKCTQKALNHLCEAKMPLGMSGKGIPKLSGEEYIFRTYKIFPKCKRQEAFLCTKTTVFPADILGANIFFSRIST